MSRWVGVGTGRCGTQYVTELARRAGIRCGHEAVYSFDLDRAGTAEAWEGYDADVSLAAAGYWDRIGSDWPVLHIRRDPYDILRSFLGLRFWSELGHDDCTCAGVPGAHLTAPYAQFLTSKYPLLAQGDEITRACRYITAWSELCRSYDDGRMFWPVYVDRLEPSELAAISRAVWRVDIDADTASEIIAGVPTDLNGRQRAALPELDRTAGEALTRLRKEWGYT